LKIPDPPRAKPPNAGSPTQRVYTQTNNVVAGNLKLLYAIAEIDPSNPLGQARTHGRVRHAPTSTSKRASSIEITHRGRTDVLPLPEAARFLSTTSPRCTTAPTSCFACRIWGLRSTRPEPGHRLRPGDRRDGAAPRARPPAFDYDGVFGTVLSNRFCVQAVVGHPPHRLRQGGQTRGMLDIRDTLACVELAITNPAEEGELPGLSTSSPSRSPWLSWPRWSPPHSPAGSPSPTSTTTPGREGRALTTGPRTPSCSDLGPGAPPAQRFDHLVAPRSRRPPP